MLRRSTPGALLAAVVVAISASPALAQDEAKPQNAVVQYAEKFGVTRAEAEEVLELQRHGGDIVAAAKEELGPEFGGAWFDNATGKYVIGDAGAGTASDTSARRVAAEADVTAGQDVVVERVQHSRAHLDDVVKRVTAWHKQLDRPGDVLFSLDPSQNAVIVKTPEGLAPKIRKALLRELPQDDAIKVETGSRSLFDIPVNICGTPAQHNYCSNPLRGGVTIFNSGGSANVVCTAGFMAVTSTQVVLVTAGHCARYGGNWYSYNAYDGTLQWIGGSGGAYTWFFGGPGDAGLITTAGSFWAAAGYRRAIVDWNGNQELLINGRRDPAWGDWICHAGIATGSQCGSVIALNAPWTPSNEPTVSTYGMFYTDACSAQGDSGGPHFIGDLALGVHNGGSCGGPGANVSVGTPQSVLDWQLGAYIVTGPWPGFY